DYWNKEEFEGGQYIVRETPIEICPIYIKSGSIIPNLPDMNYIGEKDVDTLILDIYGGKEKFEYIHYQDDGKSFDYKCGKYNLYKITVEDKDKVYVNIELIKDGYDIKYDKFKVNASNIKSKVVIVNTII
ncbi:MAG: DUF5110 domain-containing protein, partial [Romboutsia sp.]|uniref:DUF5110 domain-containing protein n=1 Tax=Romboutsia sp. TaxID=1965302 RepID=UPI003F3CC0E2